MSKSTRIIGFHPVDDKWQKMKAVYDACVVADIQIPDEVIRFFEYRQPDNTGVKVEINDAISAYDSLNESGYEVDIRKLPKNVHVIRFYQSW